MSEFSRLVRHLVGPLVAFLVSRGFLPEYMQSDAVEFLTLSIVLGSVYAWSFVRDRRGRGGD